jgi:hypothetical protein
MHGKKALENNHEAGGRVIASHYARSGAVGGLRARFREGRKRDRRASCFDTLGVFDTVGSSVQYRGAERLAGFMPG